MYALFWRAANATSLFKFKKAMEAIDDTNPMAKEWLVDIGDQSSRWTKYAFDPNVCCDENKTNFVESFNATLGVDRCKPFLTLLEGNLCFKLFVVNHKFPSLELEIHEVE